MYLVRISLSAKAGAKGFKVAAGKTFNPDWRP